MTAAGRIFPFDGVAAARRKFAIWGKMLSPVKKTTSKKSTDAPPPDAIPDDATPADAMSNGKTPANTPLPDSLHAEDAERAILGALLVNNDLFSHTDGKLKSEYFYGKRHPLIFRVMNEMHANGFVDPLVLFHRLQEDGNLPDAGGREYIAAIADIGAAAVNMPAYVRLVRDKALIRNMIKSLNDSINEAHHPAGKEPMKLLDEAAARLSEISSDFIREYGGFEEIGKLVNAYFDKISDIVRTKNYDSLRGAPTGFKRLDFLTAGLHNGDLAILAGRPGTGKTAFGLNLVRYLSATEKTGVLCFSLEMSAEQLAMRMLSHGGVDMHKLRVGRGLTSDHLGKLAESSSELATREIHIDDNGMLNILEARARARRLKNEMHRRGVKLGLIFVDYLQLMDAAPGEKNDSRVNEVSSISRGLKALAKELDVPVLAASQLNRSVETRQHKQPMLSDLRESGAIEQDADLILFLHNKDDQPQSDKSPQIKVQLTIGKQRNGPVGSLDLYFDRNFSTFREIDEDGTDGGDEPF